MVAEADDALMEKFFDAGTLTQEELLSGLKRGIAAGRVFPVALRVGHGEHRHAAAARRARRLRAVAGRTAAARRSDSKPATRSQVSAAEAGARGRVRLEDGRRSVRRAHHDVPRDLRRAQGRLDGPQRRRKDTPERLGHLVLLQGKTQTNVPEIKAGDIGAVAKLKETQTSDLLADKAVDVHAAGDQVSRSR